MSERDDDKRQQEAPTPRTDAHCEEIGGDDGLCYATFARQLERELAAAKQYVKVANEHLNAAPRPSVGTITEEDTLAPIADCIASAHRNSGMPNPEFRRLTLDSVREEIWQLSYEINRLRGAVPSHVAPQMPDGAVEDYEASVDLPAEQPSSTRQTEPVAWLTTSGAICTDKRYVSEFDRPLYLSPQSATEPSRTPFNICKHCGADLLPSEIAASGNYVCDRDTDPQEVTFANGRTVRLVGDGHLVIGWKP